jgi:two-component system CheB/CheR fusion protein
VPGCATGEEAYSIAIVVAEALGTGRRGHDVRIFATDVDEAALRRARRGTYPAAALHNVPKAYRQDDGLNGCVSIRSLTLQSSARCTSSKHPMLKKQ